MSCTVSIEPLPYPVARPDGFYNHHLGLGLPSDGFPLREPSA